MDHLWSPWRYTYISKAEPSGECIFCRKPADHKDKDNFIVHRAEHNFVLLNLYPYTSGHLMIAPYAHVASLSETNPETLMELMELTRDCESVLKSVYNPPGLNVGMNIGACAGAGVAGHIHMHILPRWPGDVNFMTAVGETRVLPEDLGATWEKLSSAFASRLR
jgi:ATP adenylyltransferase